MGVACVRNEADVLECWARYNLRLLDELQVIDHVSDDRTGWVLQQLQAEGLPLVVHRVDDPSDRQAATMNQVARQVAARPGVGFVLPLDADELLALPDRAALHAVLARIPPGCAGAMRWRTYLPAAADHLPDQPFFRRMVRFRSHAHPSLDKLVLPAALCASHGWTAGAHNALHDQTGQPVPRVDLDLPLARYPVRDAAQLARKVLLGSQAALLNPQRGPRESWHWLALARQLLAAQAGGPALDLQQVALACSLGDAVLADQQVLVGAVPDAPALQQRHPVPAMALADVLAALQALQQRQAVALLWATLATAPTQLAPWLDLARAYAAASLPWQAGYAARQALRLDSTQQAALQALAIPGWQDPALGDAQLGRPSLASAAAQAARCQAQVAACPGDWLSWLYLARLQEMLHAGPDAPVPTAPKARPHDLAQAQAQQLEPIAGESLHWLGVWRLNAGDAAGAVAALAGLLDIRPLRHGSMMYLGEALLRVGNGTAAEKAFARAAQSRNPDFLQALAARLYGHNFWQEALAVLQQALVLRPDSTALLLALARMQSEVYALADCRRTLARLQALAPGHAEARLVEAGLQGRMGDAAAHLATLQTAYADGGDPLSRLASSIAMTALYQDGLSPAAVADLHRRLCAPIEASVHASMTPRSLFGNPRHTGRRLRLGLLTGDLHRQHPVNLFMLPLMQRLDPARFELCTYHTGRMHDHDTRRAQACAQRWLEAAALDDHALQQAIVADGVDLLIDLAGHTATHRLGVLALRAAPVQATFLGYPHSTGLSTIDWLIGDAVVSPAAHAGLFSEGIAQLPGSVFCWAPVDAHPLPAPRPAGAPLVLGSFNNAMKLGPRTVALWARVLQALPGAQLLLKAPSLKDAAVQARFAALFAARGIGPERLMFRGPVGLDAMMQEYGDLDIALDPTPYNGGTTTLQALWMGVPVVALAGGNFVARMGASFLTTLGRPAWVAADDDAYVAAVCQLAADLPALRQGRAALRASMAASPLCDIASYAGHFQALLQAMWARHCAGDPSRLLSLD